MRSPSLGFEEPPWPMSSGRMRKCVRASSNWPGPKSTPANSGRRNWCPVPPVPCRIRTALVTRPAASRRGVPSVVSIIGIASGSLFAVKTDCPLLSAGSTLPAGSSCQLQVTFSPAAAGLVADQITLMDSAGDSPQTITVTGQGIAPAVTFSPSSLTFSPQVVGTTSSPQSATLTNTGTVDLLITSLTPAGNSAQDGAGIDNNTVPFTETDNCPRSPATVPPGGSCTINVQAAPATWGTLSGSVVAADNALNGPQYLYATGTAYSGTASFSSTTLNLNAPAVGQTSSPQTLTLSNTGSSPLFIASINGGGFGETNNCPIAGSGLAAGSSCLISMTYTANQTGSVVGGLSIIDSSSTGFDQSITVYGSTGAADFTLEAAPSSATVLPGETATYPLRLTPLGGFNSPVALSCTGAPQHASCSVQPPSLTPNGFNIALANAQVTTGSFT